MALVSYEEKINHMRNYYMKKIKKILESSKNKKETLEIILSTLVTTYLENKRTPNFRKIIENKNIHIDDFDNIEIGNIDDENIRIFMNEQLLEEKILKYLIYDLKNELKEEQIDEYDDEYDDEITEDINAVIDNIQDENEKKQIKDIINYYQSQYNAPIEFIAHGGSVEVFAIGDKIIKFGNKRRTNNIPRTLKYDNITTYHEGETEVFMYVEDRIRNISKSDEDVKEMYFFLRDNGFIWTDPKPDNIAIKDNQPILIDDIDVYDEKIYIKENTKSVLEFLTHRNYSGNPQKLAELEIMWLERTQPDFDIEKIDSYFSHQDNSTKRVITDLKDNYKAKKRKYEVSEDTVYLKDFFEELEQTIDLEKILNEIKQNNLDDKAIYNLLTRYNVPTEGNSKLIEKIPDIIEHLRQSVGERKITISQQSKSDALYLTNGIIRNNSLKLYIPYDKEHIAEASKKIFDFIISKNIFHQSRIAYNCSNEDLIICVNSTGDAEQIIEFINNDSFLADNLLKVNPFLPQKNGVGITINTKKSFTETLSQIIANFCKERGREYLNTDNLNNYINLLNFFESIKTERNEDLSNIYSILETTTTKFSENDPYDIVKKKSEFVNIMPQIKDYLNKNAIPYLNDEEGIKLYFKDILEKLKNQSQQQETNQENIELETVVQNLTLISMGVKRLEDQIIQLQENIRRLNTRDLNYQAKKDEYQKGIEEITAFLKIPLAKIKQTIYQFLSDYQKTNEEGFTM